MARDLKLHRRHAKQRISRIRETVAELKRGRGAELATLITHAVDKFDRAVKEFDKRVANEKRDLKGATFQKVMRSYSKKFERLAPQLDTIYYNLARYRHCVDREDVAIGLQHLLDVLMDELVGAEADPMIYLDSVPMYSTVPLVDLLNEFDPESGINPAEGYTGRQPIVVNLPALDPDNALLAPVLAHEVAHTAVQRSLSRLARERMAGKREEMRERARRIAGDEADDWAAVFDSWVDELMCDAVALVVSGPSFMFAFHGYLPPSNVPEISEHPAVRDRMRFHLWVLEELGWVPLLNARVPSLMRWYAEVSMDVPLSGHPAETFLREAIQSVEGDVLTVAREYVSSPFVPVDDDETLALACEHLHKGVPAVQISGQILSTWMVVLAGWLAVFQGKDRPIKAMKAIHDRAYNAVLLKALELSSVVTKWEEARQEEEDERTNT